MVRRVLCVVKSMRQVAKVGAVLLVLLMLGAPLVACMLPAGATSAEEQACCREMGNQCGSDQMPSSHSCCKTLAPSAQLAIAKKPFHLQKVSLIAYLSQQVVDSLVLGPAEFSQAGTADHSPPETVPSAFNILRI